MPPRDRASDPSKGGVIIEQAALQRKRIFNPFCTTHLGAQIPQIEAHCLDTGWKVRQNGSDELEQ